MTIAAWLFGVVLAWSGTWLTIGSKAVTRDEISHIVSRESPYTADRRALNMMLATNTVAIEKLTKAVESLKVEQVKTNGKLDALLKTEFSLRSK